MYSVDKLEVGNLEEEMRAPVPCTFEFYNLDEYVNMLYCKYPDSDILSIRYEYSLPKDKLSSLDFLYKDNPDLAVEFKNIYSIALNYIEQLTRTDTVYGKYKEREIPKDKALMNTFGKFINGTSKPKDLDTTEEYRPVSMVKKIKDTVLLGKTLGLNVDKFLLVVYSSKDKSSLNTTLDKFMEDLQVRYSYKGLKDKKNCERLKLLILHKLRAESTTILSESDRILEKIEKTNKSIDYELVSATDFTDEFVLNKFK